MTFLCILKAIVAWLILMFVGMNLIGFIVRGLLWSPPLIDESPDGPVREMFSAANKRMSVGNAVLTLVCIVLAGAYLFALFYFWNAFLAVAGGLAMATRIPDLIWEVRTGKKVMRRSAPRGPLYIFTTLVMWLELPLIWYALCWLTRNA